MKNIQQKGDIMVPVAIVIAAVIIALAVIFTNKGAGNDQKNPNDPSAEQKEVSLAPVTDKDHIRGNLNAKVTIVEFSDIECPFCKRFHETMKQVKAEYGDQVAWVYRHYPLVQLHPKAFNQANATECVAEIAGEESFWQYLDMLYERTPSNNRFDLANLVVYAEEIGVNRQAFLECQDSMRYKDKVNDHVKQAMDAGAQGTPHSVIITASGKIVPIMGAQPFENVKQVLDQLLAE